MTVHNATLRHYRITDPTGLCVRETINPENLQFRDRYRNDRVLSFFDRFSPTVTETSRKFQLISYQAEPGDRV